MANIGNGNRGRFSDRLRQMRYKRLYGKKKLKEDNSEISYKTFLKVLAVIPLIVVDNVFDKPNIENKKQDVAKGKTLDLTAKIEKSSVDTYEKKQRNRKKIEQIDVNLVRKKQESFFKRKQNSFKKDIKKETDGVPKEDVSIINVVKGQVSDTLPKEDINNLQLDSSNETTKKQDDTVQRDDINPAKRLEKKIIDLIKKDLVRIVNTLEVYESELYVLSEINNDEKTLAECRKNLAEVRKILGQIEDLKRKYDYLRDSYDFEYLLEFDNAELVDKIIELRDMFGNNEVRATVADYKLLEVYKYLYVSIDEINENVHRIESEKAEQEQKLAKRDIDFEKLKSDVYNVDRVSESYDRFVREQNKLMSDISSKVSFIDSREVVDYHLKGFGKYLAHSFKYLGLLMLNPLKGFFPSIASQTILARNMVHNLRDRLTLEENRSMVYSAIDYSSLINYASRDLDYTSGQLEGTLDDLEKLKIEYNNRFRQYQGDFSEYYSVISKITSMQEAMINNRIKLEIMKNQVKKYSRDNQNKMRLVKKLNDDEEKGKKAS